MAGLGWPDESGKWTINASFWGSFLCGRVNLLILHL